MIKAIENVEEVLIETIMSSSSYEEIAEVWAATLLVTGIDFTHINALVREKWPSNGLERIRKKAWLIYEESRRRQ